MYEVFMLVCGSWILQDKSASFSNAWDYAKYVTRRDNRWNPIKIVGPEGEWAIK